MKRKLRSVILEGTRVKKAKKEMREEKTRGRKKEENYNIVVTVRV